MLGYELAPADRGVSEVVVYREVAIIKKWILEMFGKQIIKLDKSIVC